MNILNNIFATKTQRSILAACSVFFVLCTLSPVNFAMADDDYIEDKTSQFDDIFSETTTGDTGDNTLAEQIRAQRAALDAADATNTATKAISGGANACDSGLRACMKKKCGDDFSKCAGDGDTIWGDKMESCKRDLPCTGHEFQLLSAEIKGDRDINAQLSLYNSIVDCGNKYNDCIITECGTTFTKCLGKSAGDKAISACAKIAKSCTEQDSGLAARAMEAFGALRENAEIMVKRDEERLYELRDKMGETCQRLGAMFDERTLDCVYTVNFYGGEDNTLYASKKRYAGSTFDCTPNWFGIDVTTFMENAMRLTREQTAASSAMLGSGLGMAAGAVTSGAIDRAVDTKKAKNALKDAEKEAGVDKKSQRKAEREEKKTEREQKRTERKAEREQKRTEKEQNKKDSKKGNNGDNSSTGGGKSTSGTPTGSDGRGNRVGNNNPVSAFNLANQGVTYTSTANQTQENNSNTQQTNADKSLNSVEMMNKALEGNNPMAIIQNVIGSNK